MGILLQAHTKREHWLGSRHMVGRMEGAHLRLERSWVSGSHAAIRWTAEGWELRDLGSRNGTFVEGKRVESGGRVRLEAGMRIAFGRDEETWELVDDGPPEAYAYGPVGQVSGEDDVIGLPDSDDPEVFVYATETGWFAVHPDQRIEAVVDGDTVMVQGKRWHLSLPRPVLETRDVWSRFGPDQVGLTLQRPGADRDVRITVRLPSGDMALEHRAHHEVLYRLACRRVEDQAADVAPDEAGWTPVQDLAAELGVKVSHLNMNIYRARQQFGNLGLQPADALVERRRGTGQVRLGLATVQVILPEPATP